jgi:hypothetical protein
VELRGLEPLASDTKLAPRQARGSEPWPVMSARDRARRYMPGSGEGRAGWRPGGSGSVISGNGRGWRRPSGGLRGGDGDGAARAELFQLPQQVGSALFGRFPLGVEVSA